MQQIVIVEDSVGNAELLSDALTARGYAVRVFGELAPAQDAIAASPPDLVITDIHLPDGSGLDLISQIRDTHKDLPVVVVSGLGSEEDMLAGFQRGASEYLVKPIRMAELLAKCAVYLSRRGGGQALGGGSAEDPGNLPEQDGLAFGRYRILELVRRDGGDVVYAATDETDGQPVNLKVLGISHAISGSRDRFLRETYTLSGINDPNVVRVLDFGACEGRLYYAVESVPGPTLFERVRADGAASATDALGLIRGLGRTLSALGQVDLIHRDLRPSSVVLRDGSFARPVLVDFGLAKQRLDRALTLTGDGVVGSLRYSSPEAVAGQAVDQRSDLFSLGVLLRFVLTGEELWPDLRGMALGEAILHKGVPAPAGLPPTLHRVFTKLTAHAPQNRYQSADELLAELDRADGLNVVG
jgi:DNA-binding response OmpR family regulator